MSSNLPHKRFPPLSAAILSLECTRVPVTAVASSGVLLIAAEGPFLRFFGTKNSQYVSSKRVFKAQAVHGISVYAEVPGHVIQLVVWGGRLVRAVEIRFSALADPLQVFNVCLSNVEKASDWILDLAPRPYSFEDGCKSHRSVFAAVTAHNALAKFTIDWPDSSTASNTQFITIYISELVSSSRSILYSAHLLWESSNRLLVAVGTAFGEIIYWSWSQEAGNAPLCRIHNVFLGHEGSIFGIQISKELQLENCPEIERVIASCSDDRTIRIWDISKQNDYLNTLGPHHTGFSNEAFDSLLPKSSDCLAIGWGHVSRIWTVRFLDLPACKGSLFLLSTGEDATARSWELVLDENNNTHYGYQLLALESAANHSGKSIWSSTIHNIPGELPLVICGAADSKITGHSLVLTAKMNSCANFTYHTIASVLARAQLATELNMGSSIIESKPKSDSFRSYCFMDDTTVLITTNFGKVFVAILRSGFNLDSSDPFSKVRLVTESKDLMGYSLCASSPWPGVAFVASAKGNIYTYCKTTGAFVDFQSLNGKVGNMLAAKFSTLSGNKLVVLLVTVVGQKQAQLIFVDMNHGPKVSYIQIVPISDWLTGSTISSMTYVETANRQFLLLGFRRGSIAMYSFHEDCSGVNQATMIRIIEKSHGDETVTSMAWYSSPGSSSPGSSSHGHLVSVGRDGRLAVHFIDLVANIVHLIHNLALPFGPNIEGLYFHDEHLFIYGFSGTKWVLYNATLEQEFMKIETGGAHRAWAFQPHSSSQGGTILWTRAAGMHIIDQAESSHTVFRSGGHGREIKAVAVSPRGRPNLLGSLIATGAEDTDIKIFQYYRGELICRTTIRQHTTGVQHLQWSGNGQYLFSSGGCEEFIVWRIRELPPFLVTGVVCEHVYTPESEYADLRVMSFDVAKRSNEVYIISMVFSDSSLKVYSYAPESAVRWQPLARGTYSTCCLTQCMFLSTNTILTAGTDGYAVTWPYIFTNNQPIANFSDKARTLHWQQEIRMHQNSSKAIAYHRLDENGVLIASGGDDGGITLLFARIISPDLSSPSASSYAFSKLLLHRAHASAVTACAIIAQSSRIFIVSSGNDEWVKLWEVTLQTAEIGTSSREGILGEDWVTIGRLHKIKTNVADVSSMSILNGNDDGLDVKILLCGVGMEVLRLENETLE